MCQVAQVHVIPGVELRADARERHADIVSSRFTLWRRIEKTTRRVSRSALIKARVRRGGEAAKEVPFRGGVSKESQMHRSRRMNESFFILTFERTSIERVDANSS